MIWKLPDEARPEPSARLLDRWVREARELTGGAEKRIGWVLSSTVVIAALQRALGPDGVPLFLVKGGLYLELRLGLGARATKDVDTLFRGSAEEFESALGEALAQPWGPFLLQPTALERVDKARRLVKPYRFDVRLVVRGTTWRRIRVEVSFREGRIGERSAPVPAPAVAGFFGVEAPGEIAAIAMDYQAAQKLHASSDPDVPPDVVNDRVRDIVDLVLMRAHFYADEPVPATLRAACLDLFAARAAEADAMGVPPRPWPPVFAANTRWREAYPALAASVGLEHTLDEAISLVEEWVAAITPAGRA